MRKQKDSEVVFVIVNKIRNHQSPTLNPWLLQNKLFENGNTPLEEHSLLTGPGRVFIMVVREK